ncbi:hypothetical protein SGHV081 [Glossina pallidipes salivary gland hypertrophy virus]|uniref:Uncharacterized protein n=1 Tax=Glossina hytrovirus (isolate Glossina pallidipes/Ethiopia/Seibersdorf/-) TaxID=379529 RepID=B0YLN5_GHVS|nr:hypothetical protein SGHV081 [Glossina pallidipes salivary gland hypertrophy virus]ABQ08854.1 hypothetical protein SGHV081 [Glossina pallidipes salivary gland hypertrophy virus]
MDSCTFSSNLHCTDFLTIIDDNLLNIKTKTILPLLYMEKSTNKYVISKTMSNTVAKLFLIKKWDMYLAANIKTSHLWTILNDINTNRDQLRFDLNGWLETYPNLQQLQQLYIKNVYMENSLNTKPIRIIVLILFIMLLIAFIMIIRTEKYETLFEGFKALKFENSLYKQLL